jgi:hypothetical protein
MAQIFVSYSRHDSEFVDKLIAELEKLGYSVWVDRENIRGGDSWLKSIAEGIDQCNAYLIVLSPNSVASKMVARELTLAFEKQKPIIPLRYKPYTLSSDMEFQLAGTQYIDFYEQDFASGMQRLAQSLTQHRGNKSNLPTNRAPASRPAQATTMPRSLIEVIGGTWSVEGEDKSARYRITIQPSGRYTILNPVNGVKSQGAWHIESENRLIMLTDSPKGFGGTLLSLYPSPVPKIDFNREIMIFHRISEDELEGESHLGQITLRLRMPRIWHRVKTD